MSKPKISIIGMGAVGKALALSMLKADYPIDRLVYHDDHVPDVHKNLTSFLVSSQHLKALESDLVFFTVRDDEISTITESFSELTHDAILAHCSGALTSDAIQAKKTAAFHPMKSFSTASHDDDFEGAFINIETEDDEAFEILSGMAKDFKAHSFRVSKSAKGGLHIASAIISNYAVALAQLAVETAESQGMKRDEVEGALLSLLTQTVSNMNELGVENALTGPIARGDVEVVKAHLNLLESNPVNQSLYKQLGLVALDIIIKRDSLPQEKVEALKELING